MQNFATRDNLTNNHLSAHFPTLDHIDSPNYPHWQKLVLVMIILVSSMTVAHGFSFSCHMKRRCDRAEFPGCGKSIHNQTNYNCTKLIHPSTDHSYIILFLSRHSDRVHHSLVLSIVHSNLNLFTSIVIWYLCISDHWRRACEDDHKYMESLRSGARSERA